MKKLYIFLTVIFLAVSLHATSFQVQAYTAEEKQAAKNWLSANGYPPTMAGAEQAYQDYLNGMYDSNGNRIPQTEAPTEPETKATEKPDDKKPPKDKGGNPAADPGTEAPQGQDNNGVQIDALINALAENDSETAGTAAASESESESERADSTENTSESETAADSQESETSKKTPAKTGSSRKASAFAETAPLIIGPAAVVIIGGILLVVKLKGRK